ncbi:uncharacterized protein sb:cb288 [Coregonus clupeaformis]|uniref:Uncharacterized protein n=1 Tax=Coregonus suidteri TaxID=861788 RepID=A0AAN8L5U8_9TELE|nr:uncharacterized protein sb:cb288 [Coregonus clupeaformis]
MWTEVKNQTKFVFSDGNTSERAVPMHTWVLSTDGNDSTVIPRPSYTDDPLARGSGIIPGAIAAAVFIGFVLALYAVLWKCMVSPPQRKKRRVRVRDKRSQVC